MDNILLESALEYARRGWWVFPCRECPFPYIDKNGKNKIAREKSPYSRRGFKDATCDEHIIKNWWGEHPMACIGISCGHSGLFVIDIDVKDGRKGIDNYMSLGIPDSMALQAKTPSGGIHILFKGEGKTSTNPSTGIDTRGKGGYFIAPPSIVIEGDRTGKYVALNDWSKEPASISDWTMKKLFPDKKKKTTPNKNRGVYKNQKTTEENAERAKAALYKLPKKYCDSYADWIEIGMSLYELGDVGLELWIEWSRQSEKFDYDVCVEKWDSFSPNEITLGSLFYYAK